ncbi:MAG TPA: T9SS type A sorting domain-containing protein [Flavobacteriales bacterium]|nr:T9SS type A sorting domain-containing protein [Flavobacteriales bacterium]
MPFPLHGSRFIAPFWSDVDLRGSCVDCNRVSYKLTPTALFVSWHRVGYWSAQTDLLNSFQVIITDGTDPVIPGGNNVSFCYGNMQWATSDGNSGANGSGGIPATVGVNQATGADVSYAQVGRFRELGMNYDGPYGEGSGVDWLDSAHFVFSTADPVGVSPIFAWQSDCDTISLMVGDELEYDMLVLAGGPGQSVSVLSECTTVQSYTELSNTQGAQALVTSFMAPDEADIGFHTITYVAQNDSTNPTSATGTLVVQVVPDITTGISDHAEGRLSVFPNPVESVLRYTIDRDAQDRFLQILTMDGRLIRQLATLPGAYTGTIDVHDLAPGTYFLRNGSFAMRFMKD